MAPGLVLADGDKLKQVFWNLCENAVRAMKNGGNADRSVDRSGTDWQIALPIPAPGMTPQQIEKIFEPFQSNFEGGTGLGLAIVYQIVQAHEGKVWARSKPGQGTTFVLRLRRWMMRATASAPQKSAPRQSVAAMAAAAAGRRAWVTFWSATTNAPSAKCSTSRCAAKATG